MPAASRQSRHLPALLLLALADGPQHGHAIRAELADRFPGYKADAGATYRTLTALEKAGEVTFRWDTKSRGPARKVYALTTAGWKRLEQCRGEMEARREFVETFLDHYKRAKGRKGASKK